MRPLVVVIAAVLLAGCGQERTPVPGDVGRPDAPEGLRVVTLLGAGVTLQVPINWDDLEAAPPLEGGVLSKTAVVAVWRYPRTEPLPANRAQLARAKRRLMQRIRERDPTFAVRTSELTEFDEARAIELTGRQTIGGAPYDVRSTHIFDDGAELVIDAYAPPEDFERVDDSVFVPLLESLTLDAG